jgi:hypothetical protein
MILGTAVHNCPTLVTAPITTLHNSVIDKTLSIHNVICCRGDEIKHNTKHYNTHKTQWFGCYQCRAVVHSSTKDHIIQLFSNKFWLLFPFVGFNSLRCNPLARSPGQVIRPSDKRNFIGTSPNWQVNFLLIIVIFVSAFYYSRSFCWYDCGNGFVNAFRLLLVETMASYKKRPQTWKIVIINSNKNSWVGRLFNESAA